MRNATHFTCEHCKQTFERRPGQSDEDILVEAVANFGVFEDPVSLCDGCYGSFMAWARKNGLTL
jgi:hypothetical protein